MTDTQVFAIAISLGVSFLAVLTGVLINNSRLGDVKDRLVASLTDTKELLAAKVEASQANSSRELAELRLLIERNHSELLVKIADLENRRVRP